MCEYLIAGCIYMVIRGAVLRLCAGTAILMASRISTCRAGRPTEDITSLILLFDVLGIIPAQD